MAHVRANQFAADLLGLSREGYGTNSALSRLVGEGSDARAQVLNLAIVLAAYKDNTHTGSSGASTPAPSTTCCSSEQCGYTL